MLQRIANIAIKPNLTSRVVVFPEIFPRTGPSGRICPCMRIRMLAPMIVTIAIGVVASTNSAGNVQARSAKGWNIADAKFRNVPKSGALKRTQPKITNGRR